MEYTLDMLIEALQNQKSQGVPGDTLVMMGNNSRLLKKIYGINADRPIAKKDAKKIVCEVVASRGIKVVSLY